MRKLASALLVACVGLIALAPAANAVLLDVPVLNVEVGILEPSAPLVTVDADADIAVLPELPVLGDPLVHVCLNGVVTSVLASVALDLHLDVLGSDEGCPVTVPPVVTPPTADDPLVHVCVNGVVQSVLASVATNLHLDVLGTDNNCPAPTGPPVTPPPGTNDPLVHVCVDAKVQTILLSAALNLHLDVLGSDEKCPPAVTPPPPGTVPPAGPDTPVTNVPGVNVPVAGPVAGPVVGAPVDDVKLESDSDKKSGPLAFTGNGWVQLLAGLGLAALIAGVLFKYLGKK